MILMVQIYCDDCAGDKVMYGIGFSILISSIFSKYFCIRLYQTIAGNNRSRIIKLVKIVNFTFAVFELLACVGLTVFSFISYQAGKQNFGFHVLMAIIAGIYILFTFLKIFGTKPGFIKASLILNFFTFIIAVILTITSLKILQDRNHRSLSLVIAVMLFLLVSGVYIYFNSFIVLLYNIMLEEKMSMESSKWEKVDMDGSTLSNPPTAPRQKTENE